MKKFKNLHRPERVYACGIIIEGGAEMKEQKESYTSTQTENTTSSDMDEYYRQLDKLKILYQSKKWTLSALKSLVSETSCMFVFSIHVFIYLFSLF